MTEQLTANKADLASSVVPWPQGVLAEKAVSFTSKDATSESGKVIQYVRLQGFERSTRF